MEIKIYFFRFDTEEEEATTYSMIELLLSAIEDELHYLPAMDFYGKRKLKITFFNLSKRETDVILSIVSPEISTIIRRVICSQPRGENPQDPVFMFTPPGYRTKEDEERAEERRKHGMDLERLVRHARVSSTKAYYQVFKEERTNWKLPPLTTQAYIHTAFFEEDEDEDEIIRKITMEPMPKIKRRRKPRSPRKKAADLPLDEDTRL